MPKRKSQSRLTESLRRANKGSDRISPPPAPEEKIETASLEDVAKIVGDVRWLLRSWIPFGMLSGIIAEPKIGKSMFALLALAKPALTGCVWFNGKKGPEPGKVLWCDTEGSAGITVQRCKDANLPLNRIIVPFPEDPLKPLDLKEDDHLERLRHLILQEKISLVVIDSLRGAHGEDENNSRIVKVLQKLAKIAEETKAAIVVIHHTKKIGIDEELTANSARGSNGFLAMVRVQIAIDRPDKNSDWNRVRILGENFGTAPEPIGFRMKGEIEFGEAPRKPVPEKRRTGRDDAVEWLRSRMKPGTWYESGPIIEAAAKAGHPQKGTLQQARKQLGIVSPDNIRKKGKRYEWRMPPE